MRGRHSAVALCLWSAITASLVATAIGQAQEERLPSDEARLLLSGGPEDWPGAVERLIDDKYGFPPLAVPAVLERLPGLDPEHRRQVAEGLSLRACWPEVRQAMAGLMRDPDRKVGLAALKTYLHCDEPDMLPAIAGLIDPGHPFRQELTDALARAYAREQERRRGLARYKPWHAALDAAQGPGEHRYLPLLLPLLTDPEPAVREAAVQAMALLPDTRVHDHLFPLTRDPDNRVRDAALWALAYRQDPRVFDTLLAWADAEQRPWHRNRRFEQVGAAYSPDRLIEFLERYREAESEARRHDYRYLVGGALFLGILDHPDIMAKLAGLADDPEPFIRDTARKVLSWRDKRERERLAQEVGAALPMTVLAGWLLLAGLLGLVMLAWVARLLALRYRIHSLPYSKAASLAVGQVAMHGRVQPAAELVVHPMTGEFCAFYPGADRDHPGLRLQIEDKSGRVLLDTRGAILLSSEGLLLPGDEVYVLAYAQPLESTGPHRRLLGKAQVHRSWPERLIHLVVHRLMGANARGGTARMLFSDPRTVCLIWDQDRRPFSSNRELAILIAAIALAGFWIVLFAMSGYAMIDPELAASLGTLFD